VVLVAQGEGRKDVCHYCLCFRSFSCRAVFQLSVTV